MNQIERRSWLKWTLRALLLLVSCETSLAFAAFVLARRSSATQASTSGAILCVGDSNTFGVGAPAGRSYPDQLRELLRAVGDSREVVNLGFPGLDSAQAVARLEAALQGGPPSAVLFLAGCNDMLGDRVQGLAPAPKPSLAERIGSGLSVLRTWRILVAGSHALTGDVARKENGGAEKAKEVAPSEVPFKDWEGSFAQVEHGKIDQLFLWLVQFWKSEIPKLATRGYETFVQAPDFAAVQLRMRYSLDAYAWELAMLRGEKPAPLSVAGRKDGEDDIFARYTQAWALLAAGDVAAARTALAALHDRLPAVVGRLRIEIDLGFASLLARDFVRADAELDAALALDERISPRIGFHTLLGGAALAHLLRDDATTFDEWKTRHCKPWDEQYWWPQAPLGHEWMAAAEIVGAIKAGRTHDATLLLTRAQRRFVAAATEPLRWLFDHPKATFAEVQSGLAFEAPRFSWIGPTNRFLRMPAGDDLAARTRPAIDRLTRLAQDHAFPILLFTYLNYELTDANDLLRRTARERGWPMVDMHQVYARAELATDDKKKYFSADRGHPNEAGYGLFAHAVFDAMKARGMVQSR